MCLNRVLSRFARLQMVSHKFDVQFRFYICFYDYTQYTLLNVESSNAFGFELARLGIFWTLSMTHWAERTQIDIRTKDN